MQRFNEFVQWVMYGMTYHGPIDEEQDAQVRRMYGPAHRRALAFWEPRSSIVFYD